MMNANNLEEKIIATAKELFIKKGYEQTSMSDIAMHVGINRPTLHYYFRTKEKMFMAVAGSIISAVIPKAQSVINSEIPFIEKLSQILDCYLHTYQENPNLIFFIFNESRRDIGLIKKIIQDDMKDYLFSIIQLVRAEQQKGVIRDVPLPYIAGFLLSQITFPFMAKSILMNTICHSEDEFERYINEWKTQIITNFRLAFMMTKD